jgi:5-methylthioribose kinase
VEKYDEIAAPWDRSLFEARFYARVGEIQEVAQLMPRLLAQDPASRTLLLEDLEADGDYSDIYDPVSGAHIHVRDLETASHYLSSLHVATRGERAPQLANPQMRALNHTHIFEVPFDAQSDLDLEAFEAGLNDVAAELRADLEVRDRVAETARRYLDDGPCLLHGDYFPGSWLRTPSGLRVIDPEFCFSGHPEIDLGCSIAHLAMANQPIDSARRMLAHYQARVAGDPLEMQLLARFAATEVMRRLIGVAQLPIPAGIDCATRGGRSAPFRRTLLGASRCAIIDEDWEALWTR